MSSDTFSHQVPINGTIQTKVPPGNKTNLYYILVSNLPWQTSWQHLKDHVRTVCPVDRVEVFNESTSGWVSVRGRENYDAALQLLNGGIFNERALVADGKNISESIVIRESVVPSKPTAKSASKAISKPTSKQISKQASRAVSKSSTKASGSTSKTSHTPKFKTPPSTQYAASTPPLMSPPAVGYGEWTSPATSSPYTAASSMECAPYTVSNTMSYDYSETPSCYPYDTSNGSYLDQSTMVSSPTMVQYPYEAGFPQQYQMSEYQNNDYAMYSSLPIPEPVTARPNDPSNGMVPTRQRKIIVKQLPSWINFNQVQDLIRKKAGSDADKIQHIDLPLTEGQESSRGYALITFQNEEVANKLIRRLNGYRYDGRELRADFTKEGVSENENVSRHRGSGRRDDREKKEKKESTRGSNSHDKKNKSHKSGVIIAHGSSSTSSSSKKSDSKEKPSKRH